MKKQEQDGLDAMRHSAAHLLAAAVLELWPDAKPTIGPAIENGFYYDFEFPSPISENDFAAIEEKTKELLPTWKEFIRQEVSVKEAKKLFKNNPYKLELVDEISARGEKITLYTAGNFTDLCRGGHVEQPNNDLQHFKLLSIAGAYWRADEKNTMLTRIYGTVFPSKKELDEYLAMREEAKKRDHRKLGKELDLFTFSPLVGPGLPLFTPRGTIIRDELLKFIREAKEKRGYSFVHIPHIAKTDLYVKSGHLGKYEAMMPIMKDTDGNEFVMKAMNCPHHFELYNSSPRSYRDLPLRLAENTAVYRNEKSGELSGLVRVAALTQDDTHHFVRHDQIESEIAMILGLMKDVYEVFGFKDYHVQISIRDPEHKEKYFGDDAVWSKAENILIEAVKAWGVPYSVEEGEAAFYGPKIDIMVKDAIGRMWQLTTVQLDFVQAENFQMRYTGPDGQEHAPAILHVAILGSVERFMGILLEHYTGALPLWLSPTQAAVLPISDDQKEYAEQVCSQLASTGIRAEVNSDAVSIGKKIREAELMKVPVMFIIGKKEQAANTVSVRTRTKGDEGAVDVSDITEQLAKQIQERT